MQRFYFHVREPSGELIRDEEGTELPSVGAAHDEAIENAREMIANDAEQQPEGRNGSAIEIASEDGKVIRTVCFSDILLA